MPGVRAVGVASVGGAMELECHVIYNDSRRDHVIRKLEYAEDGNKQKWVVFLLNCSLIEEMNAWRIITAMICCFLGEGVFVGVRKKTILLQEQITISSEAV